MRSRLSVFAVVCVVCGPASLLLATSTRSGECESHLRMLASALYMYHDEYGTFPPAYVSDTRGRPIHSWRVLILPYLDQPDLYQAYDFSEAWNGPNNRMLIERMPHIYRCPSAPAADKGMTNYVAVVGQGTAWPGAQPIKLDDVSDDMAETILVAERTDFAVPWTKPADLDFDAMSFEVNGESSRRIGSTHQRYGTAGAHVACVDGKMRFLPDSLAAEDLRGLLTIAGGEPVSIPTIGPRLMPRVFTAIGVLFLAALTGFTAYLLVWAMASRPE